MKKVLCLALVVVMLMQLAVLSSASYIYESADKSFTITLPDDFDEVQEMKFIGDDESNLGVTIREYTDDDKKYCLEDMSQAKLEERAKLLSDISALGFASLQSEGFIEVISVKKIEHKNGLNAAVMVFKTSVTKDGVEYVRYQKVYEFTCEEHIYTFTYTSAEGGSPDAIDESFNSIKINEADKMGLVGTLLTNVLPAVVLFGIVFLGIIRFIRTPEKRKKGKL